MNTSQKSGIKQKLGFSHETRDMPFTVPSAAQTQAARPTTHYPAGPTYSEVNEMQLAHAHVHVPINPLLTALNSDSEDGVRTGAVLIHVRGTNRTFQKKGKAVMSSALITGSCNTLPALRGDSSPASLPNPVSEGGSGTLRLCSKLYSWAGKLQHISSLD